MNSFLIFVLCFGLAYVFFLHFSHPQKKKKVIPHIKFGNIELLPNFRIHFRNTTYHLHHWLLLVLITLSAVVFNESFFQFTAVKGVLAGGIFQGLRYQDRFVFRFPRLHE